MNAVLLEPHPDDGILFSCWNLLRYRPQVITVLRPYRMADPGYPGGRVAQETRMRESVAAMDVLGVEWEPWDFSDTNIVTDAIADRITALQVDLVIAPAVEEGGHADHNLVGSLAQIHPAAQIQYLTYTRHGGRSTSPHEVPFEPGWPALKLRALACYESQIRHPATAAWFLDGLREYVA